MEVDNEHCDFQGWATVAGVKCSDGRIISHHAFDANDGATVPLVWQHGHNEVTNVLGRAKLERRDKGIYAYGFLNGTPQADHVRDMITHGDIDSLSIFANKLKQNGPVVNKGNIVEVSLVLAGANPEARIQDVSIAHGEDGEYSANIYCTDEEAEQAPINNQDAQVDASPTSETQKEESTMAHSDEKTVGDVLETFTDEQRQVVEYLVAEAIAQADEDDTYDEEDEDMKHNIFEANNGTDTYLAHAQFSEIAKNALAHGTSISSELAHADYGIENIGYLFPDAKLANDPSLFFLRR